MTRDRTRVTGGAVLALLALLVPATAAAQTVLELESTPYFLMSDPTPANPAAFPWARVTLNAGPLVADVDSSTWTAGQVANFLGAIASGADLAGALQGLPATGETLRWAVSLRPSVAIAAVQLGYGLVTTGVGTLPEDVLKLLRDGESSPPDTTYTLDGTSLVGAAWFDGFARVNAPVPFLPRLLGIDGFSAGAGYHWLRGAMYTTVKGTGELTVSDSRLAGGGKLVRRTGREGSGAFYEVGAVARINRFVALEGAYLSAPEITWIVTEQFTVDEDHPQPLSEPISDSETLRLPDVGLVGVHLRPLGAGVLELNGYYARIGLSRPQSADRVQVEAALNLLGLIRAVAGGARESTDGQWRLYASLGLGLGATSLSVRAVNLQEVAKGADAKSLGLALSASMGF